jgi:hypothetical protein
MSKSKQQGTKEERWQKLKLESQLEVPVTRLVEGGLHDRGDLSFRLGDREVVVEVRDRSMMEVHKATSKAKIKAGLEAWVVVMWKRKLLKPGNQVRQQVGPPVAIMLEEDWIEMAYWAKKGLER